MPSSNLLRVSLEVGRSWCLLCLSLSSLWWSGSFLGVWETFRGIFGSGSREIIQDPGLDWNKIWLIQLEYHIGIRSSWISTILGYHKILDSLIPLMVVFPSVSSILFPNFLPSCSKFISAKELVCIKPSWGFGPRNPWRFGLPAAVRPLKHLPKMVISLVFVASIMVPNGRMLPEPQNPRTPEPAPPFKGD